MLMSPPARHTIMVVEDFDDNRQFITLSLKQLGYRVIEATNGKEAVEMVERECPSLVLMDLTLPVLDGLSAVYRMREIAAMCEVPIIACSAHGAAIHKEAALAIGCDDYLSKPFEIEALEEMVSRLLSEPKKERAAQREPEKSMNASELLQHIDTLMERKG